MTPHLWGDLLIHMLMGAAIGGLVSCVIHLLRTIRVQHERINILSDYCKANHAMTAQIILHLQQNGLLVPYDSTQTPSPERIM